MMENFPDQKIAKEWLDAAKLVNGDERLRSVMLAFRQELDNIAEIEKRAGVLDNTRAEYVSHIYKNKDKVASLKGFSPNGITSANRFANERTINTLADAKLFGLDPELDIFTIYTTRAAASSKSLRNQELIKKVTKAYGAGKVKIINPAIAETKAALEELKTMWREQLGELPTAAEGNFWTTVAKTDRGGMTNKPVLANDLVAKLRRDGWTLERIATAPVDGYFDNLDVWQSSMNRLSAVVGEKKANQLVAEARGALEVLPEYAGMKDKIATLQSQIKNLPKKTSSLVGLSAEDAAKFLDDKVPFSDKSVGTVYLPRTVAESLTQLARDPLTDKAASGFLRGYDAVQNYIKGTITGWFPAYHSRNIIGNVANSFLSIGVDALNPIRAWQASRLTTAMADNLFGAKISEAALATLRKESVTDRFGRRLLFGDLIDEIQKLGVDKTFFHSGELGTDVGDQVFKDTLGKTVAKKFVRGDYVRNIGNMIETQARTQLYLSKRISGHSPESAAQAVKDFLFDYDNLTSFEKGFMRRAIPFYTWTRKNIGLQLRNMLAQPVQYGFLAKVSDRINAGWSQEDLETLPEWLRDQLSFVHGKKGGKLQVMAGFGIPAVDAIVKLIPESFTIEGATKQVEELLSSGAFIPKTLTELAVGRDFFKHKNFEDSTSMYRDQFEALPSVIQTMLVVDNDPSSKFVTIDPYAKKIIDSLPTSRMGAVWTDLSRKDKDAWTKALRLFTGISNYDVDIQSGKNRLSKEIQKKLVRMGVLAEFTTYWDPDKPKKNKKSGFSIFD